ncbi:MAG: hypothetical protein KC656_12490 [Myxococcales bacterium]|nr:hypothetical protein [Myxococcales bacterium]
MFLLFTTLAPAMEPISFDAVFYRGRPAFHHCYAFQGTVAYTLRPVPSSLHVSHDGDDCPFPPGDIAFTSYACGGQCQADCTSLVRKSWRADQVSTELAIRDVPGPCSGPDGSSGATRILSMGDAEGLDAAFAALRPGDGCENTHHSILLVNRQEGDTWRTWEAHSKAGGVGPFSRDLPVMLQDTWGDVCGYGYTGNGCWRPPMVRTGPPALHVPADGEAVPRVDDLTLRFQRPEAFPAVADYLLWIRWDANELTGPEPDWQHRVVRLPAFSRRFDPVAERLVSFPNVAPVPGCPSATCPEDVVLSNMMEVAGSDLEDAPSYRPLRFVKPDGSTVYTEWNHDLVPCVDTSPAQRPAQSTCGFEEAPLELQVPFTYHWTVRVERHGELTDGFRKAPTVGACSLDPALGIETDPDCLDPEWSVPRTFQLGENRVAVALRGDTDPRVHGEHVEEWLASCGVGQVGIEWGEESFTRGNLDPDVVYDTTCRYESAYWLGDDRLPLGEELTFWFHHSSGYGETVGDTWLHYYRPDTEVDCPEGSPYGDRCYSWYRITQLTTAGTALPGPPGATTTYFPFTLQP